MISFLNEHLLLIFQSVVSNIKNDDKKSNRLH